MECFHNEIIYPEASFKEAELFHFVEDEKENMDPSLVQEEEEEKRRYLKHEE